MPDETVSFQKEALRTVNALYVLLSLPSVFIGILCFVAVYGNDVNDFCQNPGNLVKDPSNELGPKGDIVRWLTVMAISLLVVPFVISISNITLDDVYSQVLIFASFVYLTTWEIIGIEKIFSNRIPIECINYQMGNNYPYVIMEIITLLFLAYFIAAAFFLIMYISFGTTFGMFGVDSRPTLNAFARNNFGSIFSKPVVNASDNM